MQETNSIVITMSVENFDYESRIVEALESNPIGMTTAKIESKLPDFVESDEVESELQKLENQGRIEKIGPNWRISL